MKIYTRKGDDGRTGLLGGSRLSKADPIFHCTGAVDELNAALGMAAVVLPEPILSAIRLIQHDLFAIGSHLAVSREKPPKSLSLPKLDDEIVKRLEAQIDSAEAQLPPLKNFILPGGTEPAARLHLARTTCRRTERTLVEFLSNHPMQKLILRYTNRLSDWLFVHARLANHQAGVKDVIWRA
jgi:cob(I)alamin adenosyltransferase